MLKYQERAKYELYDKKNATKRANIIILKFQSYKF